MMNPKVSVGGLKSMSSFYLFFKDLLHVEMEAVCCGHNGEIQLVNELRRGSK